MRDTSCGSKQPMPCVDHCMVSFVKPSLLGTRKEFCNRFVNPITNGQHLDSTPYDVRLMKRRAHVLHEMLAGCVQVPALSVFTRSVLAVDIVFCCRTVTTCPLFQDGSGLVYIDSLCYMRMSYKFGLKYS